MAIDIVFSGSQAGRSDMELRMADKLTLTQARIRKFWSANRLSKESGVAVTTILGIERGEVKQPRLDTIEKLARALGLDPFDITWTGDPLGFDPRNLPSNLQIALFALVFALIYYKDERVADAERILREQMVKAGHPLHEINDAILYAQSLAEEQET